MTTTLPITRQRYDAVPLSSGLKWPGGGGWLYTEKKDGVWATRETHGATLVGEQMRDGTFWAFDVARIGGDDLRRCTRRERWAALRAFGRLGVQIVPSGNGGEFLEAVLARGGEGVVASELDGTWSHHLLKCKRLEKFYCVVLEKHPTKQSVRVGNAAEDGRELGWVSLFGGKFDQCRVGSVLKIEAFGLTANGLMREPRPCKDSPGSWLVTR